MSLKKIPTSLTFGKLTAFVDTEEIDLHDDDSCCDHLELKAAELEMTVTDAPR